MQVLVFVFILYYFVSPAAFQNVCGGFVRQNEVIVNRSLLEELAVQNSSIQSVVDCLENGQVLTFAVPILNVKTVKIVNSIIIQGRSDELTAISCTDGPIFIVNVTGVEVSNLEIRDCHLNSSGAPFVVNNGSSVELSSVNFTHNINEAGAAALRIERDSTLVLKNCHFVDNVGNESTLYLTDETILNISSSSFVNNTADQGGGAIYAIGNVSLAIREDVIFRRNKAAYQGGALFLKGSSTLRIEDSFFIENESNFIGGGAVYAESSINEDLDVYISNTMFSKNVAKNHLGSGGAINLQGSRITCNMNGGVSFISNVAELDGGAIHVFEGLAVNISDAFFVGNEAQQGGGAALYAVSSSSRRSQIRFMTLQIQSSSFLQNRVIAGHHRGGAIGCTGLGTVVYIKHCSFKENKSSSGGALHIFDGPLLTMISSIFEDNRGTGGGALLVERNVKCNISECTFNRNIADRGGAIHIQGTVNILLESSSFTENVAAKEGGAIRAENHASSQNEASRLSFIGNRITGNLALGEIHGGLIDYTNIPRGGGILMQGSGLFVHMEDNILLRNFAFHGGGLMVIGVTQLHITGHLISESNTANFGGAMFIIINNGVDIQGGVYKIQGIEFLHNRANSDGGAVRITSSIFTNDFLPMNAGKRTIRFTDCIFNGNTALNVGGGMVVTGVGLELDNCTFTNNTVLSTSPSPHSGSGGAIAAVDGASISMTGSSIRYNMADTTGGALFIMDSSMSVLFSNFSNNQVTEAIGNGGAVALLLAPSRTLPNLEEEGNSTRFILFECNHCRFVENSAPQQGGAIYHHQINPYENYSQTWNCENGLMAFQMFSFEGGGGEDQSYVCNAIHFIRNRLVNRIIRLANVQFLDNKAHRGGALFTNYPLMINLTDNEGVNSYGFSITEAAGNNSILSSTGVHVNNNKNWIGGYGPNYASFPARAVLLTDEDTNGYSTLALEFRSGDPLDFRVVFYDHFNQRVTFVQNLTAAIRSIENDSKVSLRFTGQHTAQMDSDGLMNFVGIRLEGMINVQYMLHLHFFLDGAELFMEDPVFIQIEIKSCRIGEYTRRHGSIFECNKCEAAHFNSDPENDKCQSCEDIIGVRCSGLVAIPENHYWHVSSLSIQSVKCIGREACYFSNRFNIINETEYLAHLRNEIITYEFNNSYQCAEGYEGILCGSCVAGYGREGHSCRNCASRGLRVFLLLMLVFWSIGFVGYFIRSVIQLSKKIEFNKQFQLTVFASETTKEPEPLPETSISPMIALKEAEIQPIQDNDLDQCIELDTFEQTSTFSVLGSSVVHRSESTELGRRDLARILARRISAQCEMKILKSKGKTKSSLAFARWQRTTGVAARLHRLKNQPPSMGESMEPLSLANPFSEILKVLISFLQVTSVAVTINVNWSRAVRTTLLYIGSVTNLSSGANSFALDCFLGSGTVPKSLKRMTIVTLFPVAVFLFFVFIWGLRTFFEKREIKYFLQRTWLTLLATVYFFYIGLTKNLLRFFSCVKINENNELKSGTASSLTGYYWEEDTIVKCYENHHALLIGILIIPFLCTISIGFPVGTLYILRANTHRLDDVEVVKTYGFLYQAYDKRYWEIMIMVRKASIAAVVVFAYSLGPNMQGLLCVFILVVSLMLQLSCMPFTKELPILNVLEACSLSATTTVFVCGLMFNEEVTKNDFKVFLGSLAILCIIGTLVLILWNLVLSSEDVLDMKLLENGIMDCDKLLDQTIVTKLKQLSLHYIITWKSIVVVGKSGGSKIGRSFSSSSAAAKTNNKTPSLPL